MSQSVKKLSEEKIDSICKKYKEGKTTYELANIYGVSNVTIGEYLEGRGIDRVRRDRNTKNQIDSVCRGYKNGKTTKQLAEEYNVGRSTIYKYLEKRLIDRKSRSEASRDYNLNESVFDEITEESAYWVGFLMADGCISKMNNGNPQVKLTLGRKDRDHLSKFKDFLETNHPIYDRNYNVKKSIFCITSEKISDKLNDFGIIPNKAKIAKVNKLQNNRHFWRGVIDGDGSVGIYNQVRTKLVGAKPLVKQFKDFVTSFSNTEAGIIKYNGSYCYQVGGKYASEIVKNLYKDSNIHLDRKKQIADEIIKEYG